MVIVFDVLGRVLASPVATSTSGTPRPSPSPSPTLRNGGAVVIWGGGLLMPLYGSNPPPAPPLEGWTGSDCDPGG